MVSGPQKFTGESLFCMTGISGSQSLIRRLQNMPILAFPHFATFSSWDTKVLSFSELVKIE